MRSLRLKGIRSTRVLGVLEDPKYEGNKAFRLAEVGYPYKFNSNRPNLYQGKATTVALRHSVGWGRKECCVPKVSFHFPRSGHCLCALTSEGLAFLVTPSQRAQSSILRVGPHWRPEVGVRTGGVLTYRAGGHRCLLGVDINLYAGSHAEHLAGRFFSAAVTRASLWPWHVFWACRIEIMSW